MHIWLRRVAPISSSPNKAVACCISTCIASSGGCRGRSASGGRDSVTDRAFTISAEFQQQFGYPALTPAIKAQVLGLNAAHLFHLDPHATRCALESDPITGARMVAAHLRADDALPAPSRPNGPTTRREMLQWLASPSTRWTPA